ncbi:hypothetical protein Tco_0368872 [Tanacetum coccineum]
MQTDSNREIQTEVGEEQQTDADSAERSEQSRDVRTEVDEEQTRQVHSTESHKYEDEREQQQIQTDNNRFRQTDNRQM